MDNSHYDERIRGPPTHQDEHTLAAKLQEEPNLDMDLMQFLVIARFTYDWEPLKSEEGLKLLPSIKATYEARRKSLSNRVKSLETTCARRLNHYYHHSEEYGLPRIKTLRDLYGALARHGGRIRLANIGPATLTYLNSAFASFGIAELDLALSEHHSRIAKVAPRYGGKS